MKTARHLLTIAACTAVLLGCGHKASDDHAAGHAAHGQEAKQATGHADPAPRAEDEAQAQAEAHAGHAPAKAADEHPPAAVKLSLNGGEKWAMDDHTRAALDGIEARLKAGPSPDDVAGHQALGRALDEQVKGLIRGCTMKGEAHDQLHVWLMAFIPAVGALQAEADVETLRARRAAVEGHVAAARAHFR